MGANLLPLPDFHGFIFPFQCMSFAVSEVLSEWNMLMSIGAVSTYPPSKKIPDDLTDIGIIA